VNVTLESVFKQIVAVGMWRVLKIPVTLFLVGTNGRGIQTFDE
jgi:hypothetical protein